ncbi:MAG TPA: monovalent cation/H(+) antiporter subunit G [Candidatus Dormibacteraeota bacterium]|jgi:multicomponent Na+:H+ antiporter subunit G|nr:monovalent cation/H(+) antiporter subunit G [Candidatus Dormibacteraeota bacterium]
MILAIRDVLIGLGVAVELVSYLGILRARTPYDRLHYLVPATAVGPPFVVAALVIDEGLSSGTVKAILIALILLLLSPVLTHATARAIRIRERGGWMVLPEERVGGEKRNG